MATLTSVELIAAGRYVNLGSPAEVTDLTAMTVLTYLRPTTGTALKYAFSKATTSGSWRRFQHTHFTEFWEFDIPSTGGGPSAPRRATANGTAPYDTWQHAAATWDGGLLASGIHIYLGLDGATLSEATYQGGLDGSGSIVADTGGALGIMNRVSDQLRPMLGDVAYVAIWDRVLTLTELQQAQADGPLDVPSGLVVLWANQADLSTYAHSVVGRSTFVAGTIPSNTNLGGDDPGASVGASAGVASVTGESGADAASVGASAGVATVEGLADADGSSTGAAAGAAVVVGVGAAEVAAIGAAAGVASVTGVAQSIIIDDDFEGSSIRVADSSVAGTGDDAVISLKPRALPSEIVSGTRWWSPRARVTGVSGYRPTFELLDYGSGDGKYHGGNWGSGRRMLFSYDAVTWTHFDTAHSLTGGKVTFRHSTAFTSSPVYIAYGRMATPTIVRGWVDAWAAAHPTLVGQTASSVDFEAGTYSSQVDELGRTIPSYPLLAFAIKDASLSPPAGQLKRTLVIEAGMHAAEDSSQHVLKHLVEFLLSSDAQAQQVRANFDTIVYPLVNPVGRAGGHWRGTWEEGPLGEDDGNRHFDEVPGPIELVSVLKTAMLADIPDVVQVMLSLHGMVFNAKYGAYVVPGRPLCAAYVDAVSAYLPTAVSDVGDTNPGTTIGWFFDERGTQLAITMESGEPTPMTDGQLVTYGQAHIQGLADLLDAGEIPSIFDSGVGASDGLAVVTGLAVADVEATGEADGLAVVTGLSESEAGVVGSSDGVAVVSGEAAAEVESIGSSDGIAAVDGQAESEVVSVGESEGSAAVAGESGADAGAVGSSAGSSTVTGLSEVGSSVGSAAGTSSVTGLAESETEAVGLAAALATVLGESDFEIGSVGQSAGTSTVTGISGAEKGSVGSAAGVAVVSGVGDFVGSEPIVKWPVQRSVTIVDQRHTVEIVA